MTMRIDVDESVLSTMNVIKWFIHCGTEVRMEERDKSKYAASLADAIRYATSPDWEDAGTVAQGELTGYLARADYDTYGTSWNRLGSVAEEHITRGIMPAVNDALAKMGATSLSHLVRLDLTRIALWATYKKRFKRVPDFFGCLLTVYEGGHLPCGWDGELESWPKGRLIVY